MANLDIRIEPWIRCAIDDLATAAGRPFSEIIRDLIFIGIAIETHGGTKIKGPLGINRPLADFRKGDKTERISFRMTDDLKKELEDTFGIGHREAFRTSIRSGLLALYPRKEKIVGPLFHFTRPLAKMDIPDFKNDPRAKNALKRLQNTPIDL